MKTYAENTKTFTKQSSMLLTFVIALVCAVCLVGLSGIAAPDKAYAASKTTVKISGTENYSQAKQVYKQVNSQRAKAGKSALKVDKNLEKAAMRRAAECALVYRKDHIRPNGTDSRTAFPSGHKYRGENICADRNTATEAVSSWMNSSGHRANIMNKKFKSTGIGSFTINGTTYWVQLFCKRSRNRVLILT